MPFRRSGSLCLVSVDCSCSVCGFLARNLTACVHLLFVLQLFGVDAVGPMSGAVVSSYGPADYAPDRAVREAMRERENSGSLAVSGRHPVASSDMAELGPVAAAKLHTAGFTEALNELRTAPSDAALGQHLGHTKELAEGEHKRPVAMAPIRHEGSGDRTRFSWHPGRSTVDRGSGQGLMESSATQQALKELREHAVRLHSASPPSAKAQDHAARMVSRGPDQRLLQTVLRSDAGWGPSAGHQEELALSTLRGQKVARVAEEGEHPKGQHGRTWSRALSKDAVRLQQVRTAIDLKETDMHSLQNEEKAVSLEAGDLQQHALGLERKEMAAYGAAQTQRSGALRLAHRLLAQKAKVRALARQVRVEEKRVRQNAAAGLALKKESKAATKALEDVTGPMKKAQDDVHIANQAYTKSELALANAETTAERLAAHPKLAKEAMARIQKLRRQASAMGNLVQRASARLHALQDRSGPTVFSSDVDNGEKSPAKRAIQKLQKARDLQMAVDKLKAKETAESKAITKQLPALHAQIRQAKSLHATYMKLRNGAEAAQGKADKAKVQEDKLAREVAFDKSVLHHVKHELLADRRRYAELSRH